MADEKVYLDTSLVIEYLLATGREPEDDGFSIPEDPFELKRREYMEGVLRTDRKFAFASKLRSIVGWQSPSAVAVISPFVLLELHEWYSAEVFKSEAAEMTHVKSIQSISRKRLGELIEQVRNEGANENDRIETPADHLWSAISAGPREESLRGIEIESVDCLSFSKDKFSDVGLLAQFQMGLADIVHLLAADTLSCTHLATLDSDYNRLRQEIEDIFDLKILFKDQVFSVFKSG